MNDRALRVLEQYELEIISVRRGRGSYILDTTQGLRILSDYSGSENKAIFQNHVMRKLRDGGYERVDLILPDREGRLVVRDWEDNGYVVKEWYTGRECDTASEHEVMAAVANLARIHRLMHLDPEEKLWSRTAAPETAEQDMDPPSEIVLLPPSPLQEIQAWNTELRKIRTFIRKKNDKCPFERMILQNFEQYYEQAAAAEACIMQMRNLLEEEWQRHPGSVCHGDYDHHSLLMSGYEIATTNFNRCRVDFQVNDLYRFMRKILEKQEWNLKLGMRMIDCYTRIRPLSQAERQLLQMKMAYPEKFRKLANYYYGNKKAWISRRYMDKLDTINRQEMNRTKFVTGFVISDMQR